MEADTEYIRFYLTTKNPSELFSKKCPIKIEIEDCDLSNILDDGQSNGYIDVPESDAAKFAEFLCKSKKVTAHMPNDPPWK